MEGPGSTRSVQTGCSAFACMLMVASSCLTGCFTSVNPPGGNPFGVPSTDGCVSPKFTPATPVGPAEKNMDIAGMIAVRHGTACAESQNPAEEQIVELDGSVN